MKFKIEPNSLNYEDIQAKLEAKFPELEFFKRQNYLVAKKTNSVGANIVLRKKKLFVIGDFASMGLKIGFVLALLLLGIIIPLIIYFIAFHGKFKALEKEIGNYLAEEYNLTT